MRTRAEIEASTAARLEDCRWMAATGECLSGAASRLGLKTNTLEKWLLANDRATFSALLAREPRDHNRCMAEVSVSELTGLSRTRAAQKRRRRERAQVAA